MDEGKETIMPEHRGRPIHYPNGTTKITYAIDKSYHEDILRYAQEHGLSVPLYTAMMMCSHVNAIRREERDAQKAVANA